MTAHNHAHEQSTNDPNVPAEHIPDIGVMLYDDPRECVSGQASVAGSDATYVRQPSDLANNVIWVTNAEFTRFILLGHRNVHNLRGTTFFRTNTDQICRDLSVEWEGQAAAIAAKKLSEVATNVFRLAAESYTWKPGEIANADSLVDNIRSRWPKDSYPNNPALERALAASYQTDSMLSRADFVPNSVFMTLRLNRLSHAKKIMACPIPDDAWEYIPDVKLPPGQRERLAFCLQHEDPVLAEVVVDMAKADPEYASLAAFGQKVKGRTPLREWVSHPELLWLVRFAPVQIKSVFRSAGYKPLADRLQLPRRLTSDIHCEQSYSAGLLAENHWMALATDHYSTITKRKQLTARAVWLRAADRALCVSLAKRALDAGFTVTGYGAGAVRLRVLRSELLKALEFAVAHNIVNPIIQDLIQPDDLEYAA